MDFVTYSKAKGLQLLKDDITFIRARLHRLPKNRRKAFMLRYVDLWLEGMEDEENALRKDSAGRRRANNFLLANT